jgi:hypothetical protein
MANQFNSTDEEGLDGQGIKWSDGANITSLIYRPGQRIWSDGHFDLEASRSYKINNAPVLSAKELGPSIIRSSLRQVGNLTSLIVNGNASIGEFASFNSALNRVGLGTDLPNATLSISENGVEAIVGAPTNRSAVVGTYTNHDLDLVTDNTVRVTVKTTGEVVVGNERFKNGVLRVHGIIHADNVISDDTAGRISSVKFKGTNADSIYEIGLVWTGKDRTRQFILKEGADRFWSSESIDLSVDASFQIGGKAVLTSDGLGSNVINSRLTSVGTLNKLTVSGPATFLEALNADALNTKLLTVNKEADTLTISTDGITTSKDFKITVDGIEDFKISDTEFVIGNKQNSTRPLKLFGQLSIGVNSPDPSVDLEVKGDVSFAGKKFVTGASFPIFGSFKLGDVCWNTEPQDGSYAGWICIKAGNPGEWAPFGAIGRHNA